jgi:hypothetical protein
MSAMDLKTSQLPHPRQLPSEDGVRQAKSTIRQLDQNIEDLERSMTQLRRRIEELQQQRANYVSYISPLRRLPTEILSEIIMICVQKHVDLTVIAAICSRLRDVVLGMSRLWSHIEIPKVEPYQCYGQSHSVSY